MATPLTPLDLLRANRRLRRELQYAAECMSDIAAKLDFTNLGRSKFRLLRCYDRAIRALSDEFAGE